GLQRTEHDDDPHQLHHLRLGSDDARVPRCVRHQRPVRRLSVGVRHHRRDDDREPRTPPSPPQPRLRERIVSVDTGRRVKPAFWPTAILLVGAAYALFPVYWLVAASTKGAGELFTTSTMIPSFTGGFF